MNDKDIEFLFNFLADKHPHFTEFDDIVEYILKDGDIIEEETYILYKNFKNSKGYKSFLTTKTENVLFHIKKEHSLKKINDDYLKVQLDNLISEKNKFIMRSIDGKEYLCHKNAYITSVEREPGVEIHLDLNDLTGKLANEFIAFNKIRYETMQFVIDEIEKIMAKSSNNVSEIEKLELNVPLSDIALLFRLLEENKVFNAKHSTHIFRVIQNSFKAPAKSSFNEGSIRNVFNEPEPNSVKNLEILFTNMKISLKKF